MERIDQEKIDIKKAIEKINHDGVVEIIELAASNYMEGFESVVFYDPDENTFSADIWTSGTSLNPESRLVEVYRLDSNLIANNSWEINDILSDGEYEELRKAIIKKEGLSCNDETEIDYHVDFLDKNQLASIGVDFSDRLAEYLMCCYDDLHSDDTIIGVLERELSEY